MASLPPASPILPPMPMPPKTDFEILAARRAVAAYRYATSADERHNVMVRALEAVGPYHHGPLPPDIENKKSWSPAFKALQYRRRLAEEIVKRDLHGKNAFDALTTYIAHGSS